MLLSRSDLLEVSDNALQQRASFITCPKVCGIMNEKGLLKRAWLIAKVAICYALIIFFITAIGRVAHLYTTLTDVHVLLGLVFLALLILPLVFLAWQIGSLWVRIPSSVRPPPTELYDTNPAEYAKRCLGFSRVVARNLMLNPNLDEADRAMLSGVVPALENHIKEHKDLVPEELQRVWEEKTGAVFAKLDRMAEKKTYRSASFTSLGTAAAQNSAIDAIIQMYQMIALTTTIVRVYWTRPGFVVSFGLARDILASAGSVILVSQMTGGAYFKKATAFITHAGEKIPGINIFTGLLDKGLQAGVSWQLVNRYGKAVMKRCQAIEWNTAREREEMMRAAVETRKQSSTHDAIRIKHKVCELLRQFSWLHEEQNPRIALCAVDYILRTFPSAREQVALCKRLRANPSLEAGILQKAFFWKKGAQSVTDFGAEAVSEFLSVVETISPDGLSPPETRFIEDLQGR
jgi:hypothetical protein